MRNLVMSYLSEETGAAAAEYALILAIIGVGIGLAVYTLGGNIKDAITNASNCMKNAQTC